MKIKLSSFLGFPAFQLFSRETNRKLGKWWDAERERDWRIGEERSRKRDRSQHWSLWHCLKGFSDATPNRPFFRFSQKTNELRSVLLFVRSKIRMEPFFFMYIFTATEAKNSSTGQKRHVVHRLRDKKTKELCRYSFKGNRGYPSLVITSHPYSWFLGWTKRQTRWI